MTELGKNVGLSGQCFPVRSLTRNNAVETGYAGGAWLVAYKAEQRRRFKAVLCREPNVALSDKHSRSRLSSKSRKTDASEPRRKLDGIYLMNAYFINDPLDLCSINIAGKGLTLVNEDDFSLFKNVIHVDAGDNNLPFVSFRRFETLKTLELPLNNLSGTIVIEDKDFPWLETLDLSCNRLTTEDVLALGALRLLKVLHLTGNQLDELPSEMCGSFTLNEREKHFRFSSLEKLWLDQNNLTDLNTFTCLAGLKRLKYLNLEHNNITSVPHLRLRGPDPNINYSHAEKISTATNPSEVIDEKIEYVNKISILEEILYNGDKVERLTDRNDVIDAECIQGRHFQDRHALPFPSLRHLNLANNDIDEEEGLLTLSTWPRLEEVLIWGNPVAISGKAGPPTVMYQLGLVAGIEVERHKPPNKNNDSISLAHFNPPRKIADVPTINQTRNLLMLEAPKQHELECTMKPLPPIPSSAGRKGISLAHAKTQNRRNDLSDDHDTLDSSDIDRPAKTGRQPSSVDDSTIFITPRQNIFSPEERVFLTQAEDVENDEVLFFNNEQQKQDIGEKHENTNPESKPKLPKKYTGYEDLLNIDEQYPEDVELPKTVHGNVRALRYALDHPLTFTEQFNRYHNEKPSKCKKRMDLSRYRNARPTTVEELGSILDKMRTHTKTVEHNLENVLRGKKQRKNKKEQKEAKRLLNEVQTKYNEVRCESLRSTSVAADIIQERRDIPPVALTVRHYIAEDELSSRRKSREFNEGSTDNADEKVHKGL